MEPMVPHLLGTMLLPRYPCGYLYISSLLWWYTHMGFTQYLAASSGLVTTTQGWYPYLAPVLAPPRQVSLYTISGVCCYGSTGPLHTSTGTAHGTPYLAYPGIGGGYPQDAISGHLGGGMSGYPSQDTL